MTVKLQGCPFCGSKTEHYYIGYQGPVAITLETSCDTCHATIKIEVPVFYSFGAPIFTGDAVDIFNTRAEPQK